MRKKILFIWTSIILVILPSVVAAYYLPKPAVVYRVYVDGISVGVVQSLEDYTVMLQEMLAKEEAEVGLCLAFAQEVKAEKELQWEPVSDAGDVGAALAARLSYVTVGWCIAVNDEPLVWMSCREDAQEVLDRVANYYVHEASNRELLSAEIIDAVEVFAEEVLPEDITDVDSALALLIQGTEKVEKYVVSRGDTLWSIARSANVSEAELRAANPSLRDSSLLRVGQTLNLVVAEPKVKVRTVEKVKTYENIPFSTTYRSTSGLWYYQSRTVQAGVPGKREVVYEIEYINGEEVKRTQLSAKIHSQPVTRIVERGTARWPSRAVGMFRWPLSTGTITDRFGSYQYWRAQRHRGVDIGAPAGTSIYAAASGTVVKAAYSPSYGNYVVIDHGNGYSTLYAHARKLLVSQGQKVSKGQRIAEVGKTGDATGNHLHFEVQRNGKPIDPLQFFRP
ncbi:MAG TPA: M23 family metallopeptidase [Bacillota bacterium]|nr:M23 family metallopeptidase [Bacillota bacterium]